VDTRAGLDLLVDIFCSVLPGLAYLNLLYPKTPEESRCLPGGGISSGPCGSTIFGRRRISRRIWTI
jgi:hypothetical protein